VALPAMVINWLYMKILKGLLKFSGRLLIGIMFAACMVAGVIPILPKRKEQFEIEIKMENVEKDIKNSVGFEESVER
jgi:hypothetical protein